MFSPSVENIELLKLQDCFRSLHLSGWEWFGHLLSIWQNGVHSGSGAVVAGADKNPANGEAVAALHGCLEVVQFCSRLELMTHVARAEEAKA